MAVENDTQETLPTFTLSAAVTDEDGDMTSYTMLIEFDAQLDDELSDEAFDFDISGTVSEDSCNVSEFDIGTRIFYQRRSTGLGDHMNGTLQSLMRQECVQRQEWLFVQHQMQKVKV